MSSKGISRSISVPSGRISKGTKKRRRSDPGRTKKKSSSKSGHKIPTPPPPPPPAVKKLTYKQGRRTSPNDKFGKNKIYNEITNPIGFTFLSSGAPNGADYLYDINNNKEYNRNSRDLKKLTRREILMIERNNEEIKNAYIKEHGMKITKGGFKSRRNKNPHKKTKRRVRFTKK